MADRDFTYRVRLEASDVKRIADDVERAFAQGMSASMNVGRPGGRVQTRPGRGGALGGFGGLALGGLAGLAAGLGAREVVQFAGGLEQLSTQAINARNGLLQFAGSAEESAARVRAVQEAGHGAISELEATELAARLAATGLADSASELDRLVENARRLESVSTGDLGFVLSNIQMDVLNKTGKRLDQIGLDAARVDEVYKELNETMGENEARLQAILQVTEENLGGLELQSEAVQELNTAWENYRKTLAEIVGPTAGDLTHTLAEGVQALDVQTQAVSLAARALREQGREGLKYIGTLNEIGSASMKVGADQAELDQRLEEVRAALDEAKEAANAMPSSLDAMGFSAAGVADDFAAATDEIREFNLALASMPSAGSIRPLGPGPGLGVGPDVQPGISEQIAMAAIQRNRERQEQEFAIREQLENAIADKREHNIREQERLQEDAARAAQRAFEDAAAESEKAFKDALGQIPGLPGITGASDVTEQQMEEAAAGIPQQFADDFTRQMNDELVNGIDYANVSRNFVEQLVTASRQDITAEMAAGLPNELLAQIATQEISSGAVFGTQFGQENLGRLINFQAVEAALAEQQQQETGAGFIESQLRQRFGGQFDISQFLGGEDGAGAAMGQQIADSIASQQVAQPIAQDVAGQFETPEIAKEMTGVGEFMSEAIFTSFKDSAAAKEWAAALLEIFNDSVSDFLEEAAAGAGANGGGG